MENKRENVNAILQELLEQVPEGDLDELNKTLSVEKLTDNLVVALAELTRDDGSEEALLEELRDAYPGEDFWDQMEPRLDALLQPYRETAFLREMGPQALEAYLRDTFENMIRYQEPWPYLSEQLHVDEEQLKVTYRVLNTIVQWAITSRYSRRQFLLDCQDYFQWPSPLSEALWELLNENRAMLVERTILRSIGGLENALAKTSSFLDGFEDEDGFDPSQEDFADDEPLDGGEDGPKG